MTNINFGKAEYQALCALAFLYLRMGHNDKAKLIFLGLLELVKNPSEFQWEYKNLAIIALHEKEYAKCLEYLREAIKEDSIKSSDAALYLVKAEALWHSSRENESKVALQQYYNMTASS